VCKLVLWAPRQDHLVRVKSMELMRSEATASERVDLAQPLLTADDIAALLGVPRFSVYDYARRKHDPLPSVGVGRRRRFIRRDVEAWVAEHRSA
jgi:excisionase family DNA binding protein